MLGRYKIKTTFVRPEGPQAGKAKLVLILWFYLNIRGNLSVIRCNI